MAVIAIRASVSITCCQSDSNALVNHCLKLGLVIDVVVAVLTGVDLVCSPFNSLSALMNYACLLRSAANNSVIAACLLRSAACNSVITAC
ncbi:hypothetical protein Tco_1242875 [Tanacetum coccineum]